MFKDITPHIFKKFHCIGGWVSCTSQCVFCCCPLFCHILKWWPKLVKRNKNEKFTTTARKPLDIPETEFV